MSEPLIHGAKVSEETLHSMRFSLSKYLTDACQDHLNKIFMVDAETEEYVTYKDILNKSYMIAKFLVNSGCPAGSVVAIVCENSFDYLPLLLAILQAGAICTCINPLYSTNELSHAFKVSEPFAIFTTSKLYEKVKSVQLNCDYIKFITNIDEAVFPKCDPDSFRSLDDVAAAEINSNDTAIILYSSGTTALSKGVKQSHRSWIFLMQIFKTEKFISYPENNIVSGLLPMSHTYGLFTLLLSLVLGHKYVLIKRYYEETFLGYIEKFKMSTLYIVPSVAVFLSKNPIVEKRNLNSVKLVACGGGVLHVGIEENIRHRFKCDFLNHCGMTETTGLTLYSLSSNKVGLTGRLVPGMTAKIIDLESGVTLKSFQNGEYCLKGPLLFNGYLGGVGDAVFDSDSWFHTGDVAYYDDDEDFFIVDRLKELIKYKGYQVPPAELEMLILQYPDVESVGVVGVPDEVAGELPRAYVVKKLGSKITEENIMDYVASNISPMKKLRGGVVFVNQLPKTSTGKVNRKEIKQWVAVGL